MEYSEVTIHSEEATNPKSIPNPSTLKAMAMLGRICQSVYSIVDPASTVGSMETTRLNLIMPTMKVTPSLKLGDLPSKAIGNTARRETRAAKTGVKLVMVEDMLAANDSKIDFRYEVGNNSDHIPVIET